MFYIRKYGILNIQIKQIDCLIITDMIEYVYNETIFLNLIFANNVTVNAFRHFVSLKQTVIKR